MTDIFSGKTRLVTGGTRSFGQRVMDESEIDTATSVTPPRVRSSSLRMACQYSVCRGQAQYRRPSEGTMIYLGLKGNKRTYVPTCRMRLSTEAVS